MGRDAHTDRHTQTHTHGQMHTKTKVKYINVSNRNQPNYAYTYEHMNTYWEIILYSILLVQQKISKHCLLFKRKHTVQVTLYSVKHACLRASIFQGQDWLNAIGYINKQKLIRLMKNLNNTKSRINGTIFWKSMHRIKFEYSITILFDHFIMWSAVYHLY